VGFVTMRKYDVIGTIYEGMSAYKKREKSVLNRVGNGRNSFKGSRVRKIF
jgi:hypothetical protein